MEKPPGSFSATFSSIPNAGAAERIDTANGNLSIIANILTLNGRPFCAVNRKLIPEYFEKAEELFDEFGFLRNDDDDETTDPTAEVPLLETSQQRYNFFLRKCYDSFVVVAE